jgi:hypothetical protein
MKQVRWDINKPKLSSLEKSLKTARTDLAALKTANKIQDSPDTQLTKKLDDFVPAIGNALK